MKYRPEIDGLRAVAVVPVILFHAGLKQFSGGFVGVDVFFVISGYLITSIILAEIEQGTFSLRNFYDRRARRILPALFFVLLVSLPLAWIWLLPQDMEDYSQSLISVATFISNILFWQETGYWGTANELKPLLHTWSLAVEEQYYVLFPLLMLFLWRLNRRMLPTAILAIFLLSLAAAQLGSQYFPSAAFFLLPTRAWELAIGAAVAFGFLYRKERIEAVSSRGSINEVLGLSGLLLIGYGVYAFDETIPFPGLYALIPTVGTGLVLVFTSPRTLVGKVLGSKLLVGVGLISYSAYLWHQPIFAFARYREFADPGNRYKLVLTALSFFMAYVSWKFVERPFRDRSRISSRTVFLFSLTGTATFVVLGSLGSVTDGFIGRNSQNGITLQAIEEKRKPNYGLSETCERAFTLSPECKTSDEPEILVWGDSYAMHLVAGIIGSNPGAKIIQMTKTACGPFFDVAPVAEPKYPVSWAEGCLQFSEDVRHWLQAGTTIKYAVLSSPFNMYLSQDSTLLYRDGDVAKTDLQRLAHEFERTLDELEKMGITPVIFYPPPATGVDLGRCLAKADWLGWDLDTCNFKVDELSGPIRDAYAFLRTIKEKHRVVNLEDLLCNDGVCSSHLNDIYMYRDKGHLSVEGSQALGRRNNFYEMIVGDRSRKVAQVR